MTFYSTSFVWLLCQQSKSSYNNGINAAFDRSLLHSMQYIMYLQYSYHACALRSVPRSDKLFTKGLFMKLDSSVSLWFIDWAFCIDFWSLFSI